MTHIIIGTRGFSFCIYLLAALAASSPLRAQNTNTQNVSSMFPVFEVPVRLRNISNKIPAVHVYCAVFKGNIPSNANELQIKSSSISMKNRSSYNGKVSMRFQFNSHEDVFNVSHYVCTLYAKVTGKEGMHLFSRDQSALPVAIRTRKSSRVPVVRSRGPITWEIYRYEKQTFRTSPLVAEQAPPRKTIKAKGQTAEVCEISGDDLIKAFNRTKRQPNAFTHRYKVEKKDPWRHQVELGETLITEGRVLKQGFPHSLDFDGKPRFLRLEFFKNTLKNDWKIKRAETSGHTRKSIKNGTGIRLDRDEPQDINFYITLQRMWIGKPGADCSNMHSVIDDAFGR